MSSSRRLLADIADAQWAMGRAQGRISSGKDLQRASDSPARALAALDQRGVLARSEQLQRNASDATGWLNAADNTLTGVVDTLQRARTLVLQARNAASDDQARHAAADELRSIRQNLLQAANTSYRGRPIFGGTTAGATAYDPVGNYVGDAGAVQRPVAPGTTIQVNRTGPQVFGTADPVTSMDGDVFQVLDALATAADAGDVAALGTGLDKLDASVDRIETAQVELGARARQVEDVLDRTQASDLDRKRELSELEDTDMAQAVIEVKAKEFSYQAALNVTGRILGTSLLDYLR